MAKLRLEKLDPAKQPAADVPGLAATITVPDPGTATTHWRGLADWLRHNQDVVPEIADALEVIFPHREKAQP